MNKSQNNKVSQRHNKDSKFVELTAESHSGPLPHPNIIQGYENAYAGAAEIIFTSFKGQTEHRIEIEKKVINTGALKEILGLFFGFLIAIVTIIGGMYLALQDKTFFGGAVTFTGLALLVGAFVIGKRPENKD